MIELSVNVAEVKGYIKELIEAPGKFFSMIRYNVRESVGQYLGYLGTHPFFGLFRPKI